MAKDLSEIRSRLDALDLRILDAIAERLGLTDEVATLKAESDRPLRDLSREEDQLTRLTRLGRERGLDTYYVARLFGEILEHSVRRQQEHLADRQNPARTQEHEVRVSFQGADGAYSQMAAEKHFAARQVKIETRGYDQFRELLEAVESGACRYGVLPVENTTAGSINEAYDLLARTNLCVVGEEVWKVEHCLVCLSDVPLDSIRRVYSHPQALAQCSNFLGELKNCVVEAFTDTAMSVERVRRENDPSHAAIASEKAARIHGLTVVQRDIANQRDNFTRFMVVAREPFVYDARIPCKTSLIFATRDEEGALLKCLNVLASHALNLTKLESRPRPGVPFEYLFYVDFEGNVENPEVREALDEVRANTSFFKLLGSYPARTTEASRPARPQRAAASVNAPVTPGTSGGLLKLKVGSAVIGGDRPVLVVGPQLIESREQILACARLAKDLGADILRGGCFRHPSGDDPFEGHAERALEWLAEAGKAVGMPVTTEVLHPDDVARVAQYADLISVGGRSLSNFALLQRVGQLDRPVLLRRGLLSSIEQWLQAAGHVMAAGNQQLALCARGVRSLDPAGSNVLDLSALPALREQCAWPVLVDPAGVGAEARWLAPLARASLAAGAHGLVLPVHPDPAKARLGDRRSLSFAELEALLGGL